MSRHAPHSDRKHRTGNFTLLNIGGLGVALGIGLFACLSVRAQNLLQNPEFELPLGPTNWTVGYIRGGPPDFEIRDRTTRGSRSWASGDFGAQFRPFHNKLAHAYFTQTVTNLTPGHFYTVSGYMSEGWWSDPPAGQVYDPGRDGKRNQFLVYIEALGGLGNLTPEGRHRRLATNSTPPYTNADCAIYATTDRDSQYTVKQIPDADGKIEIRLHLDKLSWCETYYIPVMNAYFDSISLTP